MTRHLVMFTPRTGSTFLSEVIAHQYGFHQYGESWHMPWHGKYKLINDISMLAQREYFIDSFSNTIDFLTELDNRCDHLTNTENWVAKASVAFGVKIRPFIDHLIASGNTTIWLPYRKDIHKQFLSHINAIYRIKVLKETGFIHRKIGRHPYSKYTEINMSAEDVISKLKIMIMLLSCWRNVYDAYKDKVTLVCYEDHIITNDLSKFGIDNESIKTYNAGKLSLMPTPHNAYKFTDDTISPMCTKILNRHKHLIEIH